MDDIVDVAWIDLVQAIKSQDQERSLALVEQLKARAVAKTGIGLGDLWALKNAAGDLVDALKAKDFAKAEEVLEAVLRRLGLDEYADWFDQAAGILLNPSPDGVVKLLESQTELIDRISGKPGLSRFMADTIRLGESGYELFAKREAMRVGAPLPNSPEAIIEAFELLPAPKAMAGSDGAKTEFGIVEGIAIAKILYQGFVWLKDRRQKRKEAGA